MTQESLTGAPLDHPEFDRIAECLNRSRHYGPTLTRHLPEALGGCSGARTTPKRAGHRMIPSGDDLAGRSLCKHCLAALRRGGQGTLDTAP